MASVLDPAAPLEVDTTKSIEKPSEVQAALPTEEPQQDEVVDELELALQKAQSARRFEGLEGLRNTFLATTQLTISNVISTVVTALPHRGTRRKRKQSAPISSNQETREMVYGAPKPSMSARSNKGRRGSSPHQAQLPAFRRSLPALAIPTERLHQELILERNAFMAQLARERDEKTQLENWAATKIQACYRGFRSRPRVVAYTRRMKKLAMRSVSGIRLELVEMQESLKKRGDAPEYGDSSKKDISSLWRQGVKDRARRKRNLKGQQEERQHAATQIQSCIRMFLARVAYKHLVSRARDERYLLAVVRIQSVYRGYHLRAFIQRLVPKLRYNAAVQIQSLIRGCQARERVAMRRFERKCEERRQAGLPFQFSLGSRASVVHQNAAINFSFDSDAPKTSLRSLFEHRKSRASVGFKSAKWKEQRSFLRMHNVAQKMAARRARLVHRWNWTKTVVLDKRRQKRVKKMISTFSSLPAKPKLIMRLSTRSGNETPPP